jgi:hypothetical protein
MTFTRQTNFCVRGRGGSMDFRVQLSKATNLHENGEAR